MRLPWTRDVTTKLTPNTSHTKRCTLSSTSHAYPGTQAAAPATGLDAPVSRASATDKAPGRRRNLIREPHAVARNRRRWQQVIYTGDVRPPRTYFDWVWKAEAHIGCAHHGCAKHLALKIQSAPI